MSLSKLLRYSELFSVCHMVSHVLTQHHSASQLKSISFTMPLSATTVGKNFAVAFPGMSTASYLQKTFSKLPLKSKINHKAAV